MTEDLAKQRTPSVLILKGLSNKLNFTGTSKGVKIYFRATTGDYRLK